MARRPIVLYPDPVLTTPTREVVEVDDELRRLVADMIETMHAEPGVGLAANQVGDPRRLFVLDPSAGEDPAAIRVFVNPRILAAEGSQSGDEGCLSFPGIYESVTRPRKVRVAACDLELKPFEVEVEDFVARIVLHETDHLDGQTFLQRMSPLKRRLVLRRIERMKRDGEWVGSEAV